ncbi:MAG: APC family permease [Gammaproteobacteria bacterium]|nr:APC family permease [Gammaproteobacteria bacterium]
MARPLHPILGLGFGLALGLGSTIGVGILRLPGMVAAALGERHLVIAFWVIGSLYALMGALAVSELAAMIPETGGFRVYARRAYGEGVGFVIGWCDWLTNVGSLAYASLTVVAFAGVLWAPVAGANQTIPAIAVLALFTAIHWVGLRLGSSLTKGISTLIALLLIAVVVACFVAAPAAKAATAPLPNSAATLPWISGAMILAVVPALRSILTAFDGWYGPIYMAEENADPVRTLPRAIIGGTVLIALLYILINLAFVRVLPMAVLAASKLPAADAARVVFPRGGSELVTVISLLTVLSLLNSVILTTPRVLYAIGRDGFLPSKSAEVSEGGTPRMALLLTSVMTVAVLLSGSFEQIIAMFAVLFLISYLATFLAVFVLRYREPERPRPFRAMGYPVSTGIMVLGTAALLVGAVVEDPRSGLTAALFLSVCAPVYLWVARTRRPRTRPSTA